MKIEIYATSKREGRELIKSLYWFEENGVHEFDGKGHYDEYLIEIFVDDKLVFINKENFEE